jgi:hypothetical protein
VSAPPKEFKANAEAIEYYKNFSDRYRFIVAVNVAALLFVFNQGAQATLAPTAPGTFLVSLALLILSLFLSFTGYSGTSGTVSNLLRHRAVGDKVAFDMDWRDISNRWMYGIAALLMNIGVVGLVIHYFLQWFMRNQTVLAS